MRIHVRVCDCVGILFVRICVHVCMHVCTYGCEGMLILGMAGGRLLSPGREPLELHTFSGQTMNGELKMARRAPFDILVSDCDLNSAEIEHTLWDAEAGEKSPAPQHSQSSAPCVFLCHAGRIACEKE